MHILDKIDIFLTLDPLPSIMPEIENESDLNILNMNAKFWIHPLMHKAHPRYEDQLHLFSKVNINNGQTNRVFMCSRFV